SQDAVALRIDEHFHETSRFAERDSSQYRRHRQFRQPICDSAALRFGFVQANAREFRIGEHAKRYEPVSRAAGSPVQVVTYHSEIVKGHVRELRASCAIAHSPNARRSSLQSLVDFDIAARVQFNSCGFESDSFRIWRPSRSNDQVGSL